MRRTLVALATVMTAACGTSSSPAATTSTAGPSAPEIAPVPGLAAEVVRLRTDEAAGGRVHVRVTNTGDDAVVVTGLALDSPGFAALPEAPETAEFAPGRVIDLPVPYGRPVCGTAPSPAAARLSLARSGAAVESVRVPLAGDALDVVHEEECAVLALAEVVDIAVTALADDGDALVGTLTLSRVAGNEPVVASALDRSVLIEPLAPELPLELAADERTATTAVSFTLASCDPHVLSEVKKPYAFPLAVQVGEADPVSVDLPLDQAARDALAALVRRVCAVG